MIELDQQNSYSVMLYSAVLLLGEQPPATILIHHYIITGSVLHLTPRGGTQTAEQHMHQ